jgi:adenosylcobinamide-phosphate synthase
MMSFIAVLIALLVEQLKPLPRDNHVHRALAAWVGWAGRNLDAGRRHHSFIVLAASVGVPSVIAAVLFVVIARYSLLLALLFNVGVLYLCLGFRHFSHYFTDIRNALDQGDELTARRLLAQWRQVEVDSLPRAEFLRQVLEHAVLAAHRHVFGVFFGFVLLSAVGLGPAGAVLYRLSEYASRHWRPLAAPGMSPTDHLAADAKALFRWVDHVPARLTAAGFAVVGNFEEAVNAWRRDAALWEDPNDGTILAAASGAAGVQLGVAVTASVAASSELRPDPGLDVFPSASDGGTAPAPTAAHLQSMVGLVWRSVVLWMLLVALLTLANVLG